MRRSRKPTPWVLLVAVCLVKSSSPGVAADVPQLSFNDRTIAVRGATASGPIVLFGVGQRSTHYFTTIFDRAVLLDGSNAESPFAIELDWAVPHTSVWVAVDLRTGQSTVAAPEGFSVPEARMPLHDVSTNATWLELELPIVNILLVRPDVGVWTLHVGDGGASDVDGVQNGVIRIALSSMRNVVSDEADLARLAINDVLIAIDPNRLAVMTYNVGS